MDTDGGRVGCGLVTYCLLTTVPWAASCEEQAPSGQNSKTSTPRSSTASCCPVVTQQMFKHILVTPWCSPLHPPCSLGH